MARPPTSRCAVSAAKSHAEVRKLIAGPGVYICDNCIILCKNVLDRELQVQSQKKQPKLTVPKPAEIKRQLDRYCIGQEQAKKTLAVTVHNHYKRIQPEPGGGKRRHGEARGSRSTRQRRDQRRATF